MALAIGLSICAFFTAVLSGVVGMGGGAALLAVMLLATDLEPAAVVAVHAVVQLVANGSRALLLLKHVRWRPFLLMALPALPMPAVGMLIVKHARAETLELAMGAAILYAAWAPRWGVQRLPEWLAFGIAGVLGGALGVVVGAIGPITAPFFLRTDFDRHQIVATKAVCACYFHILKIVAFGVALAGFSYGDHVGIAAPMALACVLGSWVGKKILGRLSEKAFRVVFKTVLTVLAVRIIVLALWG